MGFSYQVTGGSRLLCCDSCGHAGGVRKVNCPAGYCQATALCERCRKDPAVKARLKESHEGCAAAHARFTTTRDAVAALEAAGEYVFCASVYADATRATVKCWFRNDPKQETKVLVVSNEIRDTFTQTTTYDAALAGVS